MTTIWDWYTSTHFVQEDLRVSSVGFQTFTYVVPKPENLQRVIIGWACAGQGLVTSASPPPIPCMLNTACELKVRYTSEGGEVVWQGSSAMPWQGIGILNLEGPSWTMTGSCGTSTPVQFDADVRRSNAPEPTRQLQFDVTVSWVWNSIESTGATLKPLVEGDLFVRWLTSHKL